MIVTTRWNRSSLAALGCVAAAILPLFGGCTRPIVASGVRVGSIDEPVMLGTEIVSSGYVSTNESTAELYVSDIPLDRLVTATSLEDLSGSIVHVHMFLRPKPGKTPIETTASTVTIRQAVIARGEVGLYGGGGFLFPRGRPGDSSFGGAIKDASVKLLASTPGFADRLGAAELNAGLSVPRDEAAARIMAHVLEHASRVAHEGQGAGG